ncbi:hypothetical protein ACJZ2D_007342 [Fusarium nematophilum]
MPQSQEPSQSDRNDPDRPVASHPSVLNNVWDAVLKDWNSTITDNDFPVLRDRTASDSVFLGIYVNPSLVKLTDEVEVAYEKCITNYDTQEMERIPSHNHEVAVMALRRTPSRENAKLSGSTSKLNARATLAAESLSAPKHQIR